MYKRKTSKSDRRVTCKPKRSPLKPLMSEAEKDQADIYALSYDFACRIVRLYQYLTDTPTQHVTEFVISKQILRSGTSIGANVSEAQHAQSKPDFLAKMTIASKEANETAYWLSLLHDNGYITDTQFDSVDNDMQRILRLIISIVKTTRQNIEAKR